ncbi:hypothetical protein QVH35_04550 [Candidatus Nitrosotenuis chungbukensis]|uniref:hypothetical protein n=1 Tax=Candidatus Nitrosotenuis chungbukensis TaxID=1353246 RepID=UPI002672AD34|nr:hypothetical protein [Candidatus Nitrosotenuis chungbukensis]WKT58644.1 hypothetical protein QVH35_04550 [Candidatus Nitrosotenuis chungbukensis]
MNRDYAFIDIASLAPVSTSIAALAFLVLFTFVAVTSVSGCIACLVSALTLVAVLAFLVLFTFVAVTSSAASTFGCTAIASWASASTLARKLGFVFEISWFCSQSITAAWAPKAFPFDEDFTNLTSSLS